MGIYSTLDVAPEQRLLAWTKICRRNGIPVQIDTKSHDFVGTLNSTHIGAYELSHVRTKAPHVYSKRSSGLNRVIAHMHLEGKGLFFSDQRTFELEPRSLYLLDEDDAYEVSYEANSSGMAVVLPKSDVGALSFGPAPANDQSVCLQNGLAELTASLIKCGENLSTFPRQRLQSALKEVLFSILENSSGTRNGSTGYSAGVGHRLRQTIEALISEPDLGPNRIAKELGLSVRSVHRYAEINGISLMNLICEIRLDKCAVDLKHTALGVEEIGYRWGFNSRTTYYRRFTKKYGMSPREFRKSFRN